MKKFEEFESREELLNELRICSQVRFGANQNLDYTIKMSNEEVFNDIEMLYETNLNVKPKI